MINDLKVTLAVLLSLIKFKLKTLIRIFLEYIAYIRANILIMSDNSALVSLKAIEVDGHILVHMRLDCSIKVKKDSCVWKLAYKYPQSVDFEISTIWPKWNVGFAHFTSLKISKVNRAAFDYSLKLYVYPYNEVTKQNVVHPHRSEIKSIIIPADGAQKTWRKGRTYGIIHPKVHTCRQVANVSFQISVHIFLDCRLRS